ncbi:AAA family ATPase [Limosilactobacillus mucosae]|uniref:AAA family ATPase n=2 Tax=Limosilactobacillus mucosae TaxID=97478 RepID=UPI00242CDFE3|nr:ATP-dependent Clp protease ATP-binding subunit [Limosilactobacillus mucosae]MCI1490686.1 ATP-dependent Clp protease ATP-binding subunit [Limosilactobacillus mucosae]MCI1525664.1 ATP-dependent Clp protease ATP-binding subunit [Limosilactobacillus mucosae]MDM8220694.1 ATP-dependent Clp protease ATP-binding subunit [Limosilactobacillus mucosae]
MTTETPLMDKYTDDLTAAVALNPNAYRAIARDDEIRQVIYNLNRRSKNNPILIGEAGVGKTAIVEGLARLIVLKKAGRQLNDKRIRVLQIAALGQNDTVSKMLGLIKEFQATKGQNILFIDEVHTIMGVDSTNGAMDLGDVLKPAMARGDIQLIGSTTLDEYDKFIERDPALQRRFQQVLVNEPTRATAIRILRGIKGTYEKYHQVRYSDKAVVGCVDLSIRYIADRYLPDKAIDLLDQAGAIAATHGKDKVGLKEIALVLQEMKGIPVTNVLRNDNVRLRNMRQKLGETVKGQPEAIKAVADAITIAKAGLQAPNKPLSSFLFLGTTGTGKTALSKALARVMFDDEEAMVRFDMSEFSERSSLDHFQSLLTDQIKRQPYCILLFDEIEKACTAVHDRLLQVLDDGELRDKRGRSTNFRNSIIIMTTNLGADLIADKESYEHAIDEASLVDETPRQRIRRRDAFRKQVQMELTNIFRPEFVNRIQHKIVFNMLTRDIIEQIARNDLKVINQRLAEHGFKLEFQQDLIDYLADVGTDVKNGARPLERVIERDVTAPLSMIILQLESTPDNHYHTIQTEVSDHRTQLERQPLQRHLINGRQIIFKQLLDTNSKEGTKVG